MIKKDIKVLKKSTLSKVLYEQNLIPSQVRFLIKNKDVKVDGVRVNKDCAIEEGQILTFFINEKFNQKQKFQTVFEDENILIINKPAGIEVEGQEGITSKIEGAIAVHRLDKDTKGLLILAKNKQSEYELLEAFKTKQITKRYVCEVLGDTNFKGETYAAYLFKDSKKALVRVTSSQDKGSLQIQTKFKTIKHGSRTSLVECELLTGKTHQIRAHLAYLGHPILGDDKYGNKEENKALHEKKQKLFCFYLKFLNFSKRLSYLSNKEFKLLPSWLKEEV